MSSAPNPAPDSWNGLLQLHYTEHGNVSLEKYIGHLKEVIITFRILEKFSDKGRTTLEFCMDTTRLLFPSNDHLEAILDRIQSKGNVEEGYELDGRSVSIHGVLGVLGAKMRAVKVTIQESQYDKFIKSDTQRTASVTLLSKCELLFFWNCEGLETVDLIDGAQRVLDKLFHPASTAFRQSEGHGLNEAMKYLDGHIRPVLGEEELIEELFDHQLSIKDADEKFRKTLMDVERLKMKVWSDNWFLLLKLVCVSHLIKKAVDAAEAKKDAEYDMLEDVTMADFDKHLKLPHRLKSLARHRSFSRHSNPLLNNFSLRQQGRMLAAYQKAETFGY